MGSEVFRGHVHYRQYNCLCLITLADYRAFVLQIQCSIEGINHSPLSYSCSKARNFFHTLPHILSDFDIQDMSTAKNNIRGVWQLLECMVWWGSTLI